MALSTSTRHLFVFVVDCASSSERNRMASEQVVSLRHRRRLLHVNRATSVMKAPQWTAPFFSSIQLLVQRIVQDRLVKEAAAMTCQSFLAIVPLLAVMFGIAKGFGLEEFLDHWLQVEFAEHQAMLSYLLQFSQTTLKEAQGGIIAGIGVFFLLFTAIRLLSSVEDTLNAMWGIRHGNPSLRKLSHYLAILLTCPLLLALSSSATIFLAAQLTELTESIRWLSNVHALFFLVPFAISALLFSVILYFMPSAPVNKLAACCSGCIAAIAFQCIQSWYILFQVRLTKVSAIYGSFAALPLFLVWLWISWLLILIAGELVVFFQEKGWKPYVTGYGDAPLERIDTDVMVVAWTIYRFNHSMDHTLSDLYASIPRPIRAITASLHRLETRGYILKGYLDHSSASIIPNRAALGLSLSDLIFPMVSPETSPVVPHVAAAITQWKSDAQSSALNLRLDQLSFEPIEP